ncbi:NPC intracellular cholesterol transporter 2-like [Crassostrea virginica]|uniref:Epididymal secretory protein E1-like n=1 Tax=Crassostrea virginica TaxID=6565 RepID=A0A8B8BDQ2_CRAVI|nr:epididymal secretory protein E1-like [Crassostrea virginica]
MIKFLTVLAVTIACSYAVTVKYSGCRSHGVHGQITNLDVDPCPHEPCALPHGKNITLTVTFTPTESSSSFKSSVHGIILGLPVPYGVPLGSMSGPIVSGQEVTYTNSLYVSPAYPTIRLNVEWEVLDDRGRDLFCFIIPVHITNH